MHGKAHLALVLASASLLAGALTACSGGSSTSSSAASSGAASSAASSSGAAGGAGGNGFLQSAEVQACLKAAGITVPTQAGGRPTGTPPSGTRPSGSFTGQRPTSAPTGGEGPGGTGGGFGANSSAIQAALKACGIAVPTGDGARGGPAAPSAAPTS